MQSSVAWGRRNDEPPFVVDDGVVSQIVQVALWLVVRANRGAVEAARPVATENQMPAATAHSSIPRARRAPPIPRPTHENILRHQRLLAWPALEDGTIEVNALKLTLCPRAAGSNIIDVQRMTFALSELVTIPPELTLRPLSDEVRLGNQSASRERHEGTPTAVPLCLSSTRACDFSLMHQNHEILPFVALRIGGPLHCGRTDAVSPTIHTGQSLPSM